MIRSAVMILLASVAATMPSALHADVAGSVSVIDGDTIEIHGRRIRLHGIDAPEAAQLCQVEGKSWRCGQQASLALDGKIAGRPVSCRQKDIDRYRRIVAVCFAGSENLNAWVVAEGWALAYRQYSTDYVGQERAASAARKGIWRGSFVPPWVWRTAERREAADDTRSGPCRIKGNIGSAGERIYHVPGGRFYDQTQINTVKGERWFCTEAEAMAAGWRRSLR
jgi:endonuclease YncB( thermonuclease family)